MSSITINQILARLDKDQQDLFTKWKETTIDEIKALIKAIQREQPPKPTPAAESSRGKTTLLQERKTISHLSDKEIREIVNKEVNRTPAGTSHDQLKASFEQSFLAQGKPPDEAARMADVAAKGKHGRSPI